MTKKMRNEGSEPVRMEQEGNTRGDTGIEDEEETQDEKRSRVCTERAAHERRREFLARCQLSMPRTLSLILRGFSSDLGTLTVLLPPR